MNDLNEYRQKLNAIDTQLLRLFEERMKVVGQIGLYKKEKQLLIYSRRREKENIERIAGAIKTKSLKAYVVSWYRYMMRLSKRYQKELYSENEKGE